MNILLFGPPASGKGVQSVLLSDYFKFTVFSVGDLLRKEVSDQTELGILINSKIFSGKFIDDDIIFNLFEKNINKFDMILLDGFPRNLAQSLFLENSDIHLNCLFFLDVPKEVLFKRVKYRVYFRKFNYNLIYKFPKLKFKDDVTGGFLLKRSDDVFSTFKIRLLKYCDETDLIISYFLRKNISFFKVNSNLSTILVFDIIKRILLTYEKNL